MNSDLPEILEHTVIGPTDVLVLRIDGPFTDDTIDAIQDAVPDDLEGRVLVVDGEFEVVRKNPDLDSVPF